MMTKAWLSEAGAIGLVLVLAAMAGGGQAAPIVLKEFIYETAPFPSCHASTLAETPRGLVAAWFGGTDEGNKDVGIWFSVQERGKWAAPVEVATGVQDGGERFPCWNPVLFQAPRGPLLLFYKVGPSPSRWWGMMIRSQDSGRTWSEPKRLPEGILGPIKNKPVLLDNGDLVCPSSTEHDGWRIHVERTPDWGETWTRTEALNDGREFGAIQPTIFDWPGKAMQMYCRSREHRITDIWSRDNGKTWGRMRATALPNPNAGIDGVRLNDGLAVLVYNHTERGRSPLNVAVSVEGRLWNAALVLESEKGEYSYPAVIQSSDGLVHVTYTWKRERIRHVVIDPKQFKTSPIVDGRWPDDIRP